MPIEAFCLIMQYVSGYNICSHNITFTPIKFFLQMFRQDKETTHIWHPGLFEIFNQARHQQSVVTFQSHLPLDACNTADVQLYGKIGQLSGQQAKFVVESMNMTLDNRFPADPLGEYSFEVDLPIGRRRVARMEYSGKAVILERKLQKNDLPAELVLRISLPTRIRHVRRHHRIPLNSCEPMVPGLVLIDHAPTSRRQLLRLLEYYYRRKWKPKPRLVNISAGGVCVETTDPSGHRLLAADERYLFFFFLKAPEKEKVPLVFVGRKVGAYKGQEIGTAALRIQFLRELVWTAPNTDLEWRDISATGSDRLRQLFGLASSLASPALPEAPQPRAAQMPVNKKTIPTLDEIPPIDQIASANMAMPFNDDEIKKN